MGQYVDKVVEYKCRDCSISLCFVYSWILIILKSSPNFQWMQCVCLYCYFSYVIPLKAIKISILCKSPLIDRWCGRAEPTVKFSDTGKNVLNSLLTTQPYLWMRHLGLWYVTKSIGLTIIGHSAICLILTNFLNWLVIQYKCWISKPTASTSMLGVTSLPCPWIIGDLYGVVIAPGDLTPVMVKLDRCHAGFYCHGDVTSTC